MGLCFQLQHNKKGRLQQSTNFSINLQELAAAMKTMACIKGDYLTDIFYSNSYLVTLEGMLHVRNRRLASLHTQRTVMQGHRVYL